jgi:hypothetical protein
MTSVLASAAHAVAASVLSSSQVQPGGTIPSIQIKEDAPDQTKPLTLTGKNILVNE